MILSDRPKEEMDRDLLRGLSSYDLEWHTRSGMPYSVSDLSRVAAGSAQTILLLHDDHIEVSLPMRTSVHRHMKQDMCTAIHCTCVLETSQAQPLLRLHTVTTTNGCRRSVPLQGAR